MSTKQNIIEKIWQRHLVVCEQDYPSIFSIDLILLHEVTSAQAFEQLEDRQLAVFDPNTCLATLDHSIPTSRDRKNISDPAAKNQVDTLRKNCKKHDIPLFDFDSGKQGIVHVIGPELGLTQPGMTIVCGDSHTSTHGAFGALAFGIGTSEVFHVLASGCLLQHKPKTLNVRFEGSFQPGVFAKDAILKLIAEIGIGGATGFIIEYTGEAIRKMSMEERLTLCNMSIECGARAGIISPDETTFQYLKNREYAPKGIDWDQALSYWQQLISDEGASYDHQITIDLSQLEPMVTWGTNPGQTLAITQKVPFVNTLPDLKQQGARNALAYVQLDEGVKMTDIPIDWAFLGSCTNGRIEDLRVAAKILKGKKIHPRITFYVVPGSEAVLKQAVQEGLDQIFINSGADFRMPGCSMCLAMNEDRLPAGKRCISATNRNFVGRQGPDSITHLASPATVAASAIVGKITNPKKYFS